MRRHPIDPLVFLAIVALVPLVGLLWALWGARTVGAQDVPPPAMQRPQLMEATPQHAVFLFVTLAGMDCTNSSPLRRLTATGGPISGACMDAGDDRARWTLLVQGHCRVVFWDRRPGDAPLEQRTCVRLPLMRGTP